MSFTVGDEVWNYSPTYPIYSQVVYDPETNRVFFGEADPHSTNEHRYIGIDIDKSGNLTEADAEFVFATGQTNDIALDIIGVATDGTNIYFAGTTGSVWAFDKTATGTFSPGDEIWQYSTGSNINSTGLHYDSDTDRIFFGDETDTAHGIRTSDGGLVWAFTESTYFRGVGVGQNYVYAGDSSTFWAIDKTLNGTLGDGDEDWKISISQGNGAWEKDGYALLADESWLYCLDDTDGTELWNCQASQAFGGPHQGGFVGDAFLVGWNPTGEDSRDHSGFGMWFKEASGPYSLMTTSSDPHPHWFWDNHRENSWGAVEDDGTFYLSDGGAFYATPYSQGTSNAPGDEEWLFEWDSADNVLCRSEARYTNGNLLFGTDDAFYRFAPTVVAGTVQLDGVAVENATVSVIDESAGEIIERTTTDTNGYYEVPAVDTTCHILFEYEDANGQYHSKSLPYIQPQQP